MADRPDPVERRRRRELEAEVRFHVDALTEELVRKGMEPAEARRAALRRFGDPAGVQREVAEIDARWERTMARRGWVHDLRGDVGFALRQLRKRPLFAAGAIAVMALGVGSATAVFRVADAAFLRPLPFPDAGRVTTLVDDQGDGDLTRPSLPEVEDWRRDAGEVFEALAGAWTSDRSVQGPSGPERVRAGLAHADLDRVTGLPPLLGRWLREGDVGTSVVVLSEPFWRSRYGADPAVLGSVLAVDGEPHTIVGVAPREAALLLQRPIDVWLPLEELPWMSRGLHFLLVFGRLRADLVPAAAEARVDALEPAWREASGLDHGVVIRPLRERLVGDAGPLLAVLSAAVLVVLLVMSANLAHLVLARARARDREFAVRTALGAGRGRLARQVLTESAVLGLLGGLAGVAVAGAATGLVAAVAADAAALVPDSILEPRTGAFVLLVSLAASAGFGLLPAARAGRPRLAETLRAGRDTTRAGALRHRLLVATEVALSVVLVSGAALMVQSVVAILDEDPGFRPGGVLTASVDLPAVRYGDEAAQVAFWEAALARVRAEPAVASAALASHTPYDGSNTSGSFSIVGRDFPTGEGPFGRKRVVSDGYFETLGIPVLRGRAFGPGDGPDAPGVAVVSRALADRYWPGQDPVGRRIRFSWGPPGEQEIVGVVGDVRHDGLDRAESMGTLYRPHSQFPSTSLEILARSARGPAPRADPIRRAVHAVDPSLAVHSIGSLDALVRGSVSVRRTFMGLMAGFAAVALVLAAVGVYAVTAGSVARRTREIGVRRALGARRVELLGMIVREEAGGIALGVSAGSVGAWLFTRTLTDLLYGVEPGDPRTLAVTAAALAVVAAAAVLVPARRAGSVDPAVALSGE